MPPFDKPKFTYGYQVSSQIDALRAYRQNKPERAIPSKAANRLLVATWNVANLGVQERRDKDYRLIAELVNWFDLMAMQEVNDNLRGLRARILIAAAHYIIVVVGISKDICAVILFGEAAVGIVGVCGRSLAFYLFGEFVGDAVFIGKDGRGGLDSRHRSPHLSGGNGPSLPKIPYF